jgi:hypothetical protein
MQSDCLESGTANPVLADAPSPGELEIAKLQLQQALDTFRTQMSLLVQICTVMIIADCTVIGYSLANKAAVVLMVGSLFPILIRYTVEAIGRLSIPVLYSAVSIEQRYGAHDVDGLISTFLSFTSSPEYVQKLRGIASVSGPNCFTERMSQLRLLRRPRLSRRSLVSRWLPVIITIVQIGAGPILHFALGWPMVGNR